VEKIQVLQEFRQRVTSHFASQVSVVRVARRSMLR